MGVKHETVDILDYVSEEFVDLFMMNTSHMSIPDRVHGIHNVRNKLPEGRVELRSNIAKVGRTFYRYSVMMPPDRINLKIFTKLYFWVNSDQVLDEFDRFLSTTHFTRKRIYNYDPYDLFYWEHRMCNWLSTWMMDKDLSRETFVVFNNRTLLKKMLSVDIEMRQSDELFLGLVEELWPECLDTPINPHEDGENLILGKAKRSGYGVAMRTPLPIYCRAIDEVRSLR